MSSNNNSVRTTVKRAVDDTKNEHEQCVVVHIESPNPQQILHEQPTPAFTAKAQHQQAQQPRKRIVGFDILRCICMYCFVIYHFHYHSPHGRLRPSQSPEFFTHVISFLTSRIGNNSFFLMSGYLQGDTAFRSIRIISFVIQVNCFSRGLLWYFTNKHNVRITDPRRLWGLKHPITTSEYWFATVYFQLCVFSNFYSFTVRRLSKKAHFCLIVLLVLVFCS